VGRRVRRLRQGGSSLIVRGVGGLWLGVGSWGGGLRGWLGRMMWDQGGWGGGDEWWRVCWWLLGCMVLERVVGGLSYQYALVGVIDI